MRGIFFDWVRNYQLVNDSAHAVPYGDLTVLLLPNLNVTSSYRVEIEAENGRDKST